MPKNSCIMQIWAESGKSALPICNYSQILYQLLTFTQNLKRSLAFKRLNACGVFCMTLTKHRIFAALPAVMLLLLFFDLLYKPCFIRKHISRAQSVKQFARIAVDIVLYLFNTFFAYTCNVYALFDKPPYESVL